VRASPTATTVQPMLVSGAGADICLSFANTLAWRGRAEPIEGLRDFMALLAWAEKYVGLPAAVARRLEEWAGDQPSRSAAALAEAIALREATYGVASALAGGASVKEAHFGVLSDALALAPARRWLVRSGAGFAWHIELESGGTGLPVPVLLAPVLWSAAD